MSAQRYYVRFSQGGIDSWLAEKRDHATLAKVFDLSESEQSVYEIRNSDEEFVTLAAHLCTHKSPDAAWSIVRIRDADVAHVGLRVDDQVLGTTGVPWVDYRHRDLVGEPQHFIKLTGHICEEAVLGCGQDRLRRVQKPQLRAVLGGPPKWRPEDCSWPRYARTILECILQKRRLSSHELGSIREEILQKDEATALRFPEDIIHQRASTLSNGNEVADWYEALNCLREDYAAWYLSELGKRPYLVSKPPSSEHPTP